jgi:hypothetical protein
VPYSPKAAGGWITGGVPGRDSVPIMAMQDEFMIRRDIAQANRSWLPEFNATGQLPFNDNRPINVAASVFRGGNSDAGLLARIDRLTDEVKALREENTKVTIGTGNQIVRNVAKLGDDICDAVDSNGKRIASAATQAAKETRAAA